MNNNSKRRGAGRTVWAFFGSLLRYWWLAALAVVALAVVYLVCESRIAPPVKIAVERSRRIDVSPEEIKAVRDIGQWEFLTVSTEEMVQSARAEMFGDAQLVRIYAGKLRLGVDMARADSTWFRVEGDSTAVLTLPKVGLLDEAFIDEARSRSFYESGSWSAADRQKLYEKAKAAMKRRCLTRRNLDAAEKNARERFTSIFKAFGFKEVKVEFK